MVDDKKILDILIHLKARLVIVHNEINGLECWLDDWCENNSGEYERGGKAQLENEKEYLEALIERFG